MTLFHEHLALDTWKSNRQIRTSPVEYDLNLIYTPRANSVADPPHPEFPHTHRRRHGPRLAKGDYGRVRR